MTFAEFKVKVLADPNCNSAVRLLGALISWMMQHGGNTERALGQAIDVLVRDTTKKLALKIIGAANVVEKGHE